MKLIPGTYRGVVALAVLRIDINSVFPLDPTRGKRVRCFFIITTVGSCMPDIVRGDFNYNSVPGSPFAPALFWGTNVSEILLL